MMKPTIEAVAKQLNVSVATVSRALRGLPGVKPEMRAKIKVLAKSLGVRSRAQWKDAESAAPDRPARIGVLISVNGQELFPHHYLEGIGSQCHRLELTPTFHLVPLDQTEALLSPATTLPAIREGLFNDLILIHRWPDSVVDVLAQTMHCVAIVHKPANPQVDLVQLDDVAGMGALVDHLAGLGHQEIGYFGRATELLWARQRAAAFVGALEHAGLRNRDGRMIAIEANTLIDPARGWGSSLDRAVAETAAGVTAWICPNGVAAQALIARLHAAGHGVPRDVSVVAFDAKDRPREEITSLDVPLRDLGEMAVRLIRERSTGPGRPAMSVMAPCSRLLPGRSTGPRAGW